MKRLGLMKVIIILLVVFGAMHSGLGILATGMYLGFVGTILNTPNAATYLALASIIFVIGLTLIIVRKGRKAL